MSRRVAGEASADTGIDAGTIKKFLPIIAAAAMGALSKQTQGGASFPKSDMGGALGMIGSLLGSSGGSSTADKLLSSERSCFSGAPIRELASRA